jgi:hypothetical protein
MIQLMSEAAKLSWVIVPSEASPFSIAKLPIQA